MVILLSITIIVRIYYVNYLMSEVNINEDIYNAAKVSVGTNGLTSAFADGFQMQSLYICTLYLAFLIFGNFTVAGVYLNILYQFLTIFLVFLVIKSVSNRYVGFAGGLILAILPVYINTLSKVTMQNMLICIVALAGAAVSCVFRWGIRRHTAERSAPQPIVSDAGVLKTDNHETLEVNGNPIQDTSLKEIRYDDLEDNKVQYIENPLPVPRRREHKEMDYAFEPAGGDDYDLKDLTGKDFYDIE